MAETAMKVPVAGGGIPPGTAIIQPQMAGEPSVAAVVIGGARERQIDDRLMQLANRLEKLASEQVTLKAETEERWLQGVRSYHGFYDTSTEKRLLAEGQSRAFVKATRAKTVALEARLFDLIFPTDDRNWGIESTPVPKLSKEAHEAAVKAEQAAQKANLAEQQGDQATAQQAVAEGQDAAQKASVANAVVEQARKAADLMQEEMDDQLVESKYPSESRLMIHDACQLGSGVLKGPMVNESRRGRWLKDAMGTYALEQTDDPRPLVRRVDPWSFFPDMAARTIEEAEFTFERYLWTRKDLIKMIETHGFDADAVREIIREDKGKRRRATHGNGLTYLTQLRSITGEGQSSIKGRYIGWEYHGPLDCEEIALVLRAFGEEEAAAEYEANEDPLLDLRVVLYICEGQILKIAPEYPLDSGETLYSVFNVEESEGSIFGYGIPHIMGDSQTALNSAWRMGLDNAALSVGPQAVIDKDAIVPADGSWTMVPKKVWHRVKAALSNQAPAVEFFNVPNNMAEIEKIIQIALQFIDMETGIPMPQQGDQTEDQTKTVGGMTILQNAANIIFRRRVKNYDDQIITPTMRRLYDWNMQFNSRDDIKGDMQIDARGTSVLLLKEIQAQNLMFVVTQLMAHPAVQPMLKPYQNVMKLFQSMMISPQDVMVSEDEYKKRMADIAKQPPEPTPAEITAQARIEAAQIQADASATKNETVVAVEELRQRTAILELAQREGLTLQQINAELAKIDKQLGSQERIKAIEIAVEDQRAREAKEEGRSETEAVGQGIG
jgi:hypothetical protein